jgi:hypothetical protein
MSETTSRYSKLYDLLSYVNLVAASYTIIASYNLSRVENIYDLVTSLWYEHEEKKWFCVLEESTVECPDYFGLWYKWKYSLMFYVFTCVLVYLFV